MKEHLLWSKLCISCALNHKESKIWHILGENVSRSLIFLSFQYTGCSFYVSTFGTWITRVLFVRICLTSFQNEPKTLGFWFFYVLGIHNIVILFKSGFKNRWYIHQYAFYCWKPSLPTKLFLENSTASRLSNGD